MTVDIRAAAEAEAADKWRREAGKPWRRVFVSGAVWAQAQLTPRQATLAVQDALGCDIEGLEGFMAGCLEHEVDITEFGFCPTASAAADAVLALFAVKQT